MEKLHSGLDKNAPNGCWVWTRARTTAGYGEIWVNGKIHYTHRLSWELTNGPIVDGLWVLHKCDNPGCANPDHLFLGTQKVNMSDCKAKGRTRGGMKKGQRNGGTFKAGQTSGEANANGKLTELEARVIKYCEFPGYSLAKIGEPFGVSASTVSLIKKGKVWRHI